VLVVLGVAGVAVYAIVQLAAFVVFIVAAFRSRRPTPEEQERALMRSLSWPSNDEGRGSGVRPR
jgi:hypothetical protein